MNANEAIHIIKETPLFSALSEEELLLFLDMASVQNYQVGRTILREGDPPDWFYILIEGKVKVAKYASTGKEVIMAIFTPGNTFGEVAVFDGIPYPASAEAITEVTAIGIKREDLLNYLSQNPSVALKMINLLGTRLRDAHARLRDLAGERVEQRIANVLLMLSEKLGQNIPFTRQEIADMSGTTTETVIRITTRMKENNIISTTRGEITIIDKVKLQDLSNGLPLP